MGWTRDENEGNADMHHLAGGEVTTKNYWRCTGLGRNATMRREKNHVGEACQSAPLAEESLVFKKIRNGIRPSCDQFVLVRLLHCPRAIGLDRRVYRWIPCS